jgi:retinol dehydrogenase-14
MTDPRPVCVVTGASSGIGAATAVGVARTGYDVALTGRDKGRLDDVAARCRRAGATARTYTADFAALQQVRGLAAALLADWPHVDVLINNAGLAHQKRELTTDGYEKVFAVNHLAPYLLSRLLLDRLIESAPSRVVVVTSDAYTFDELDPDDWMSERRWQPLKAYGRSKLCNLLFAGELCRRVEGSGVAVTCVHPGFVSTSLGRDNRLAQLGLRLIRPFIRTPEKGARTSVELATGPLGAANTGAYHVDGAAREVLPRGTDHVMAARLWDDSARLVGLGP